LSIKKRVENKEKGHSLDNMICETIVLLRNRLQLSKADFAKRIGYSLAHLRRVEKGESLPTMEMIESIIKEFQLNPIWPFLDEGEDLFTETSRLQADEVSSSAGSRLVQWRKGKGIQQKELAAIAGISLPNLVEVEFGRRRMTIRFAKKIEDACAISASWLLYGDEQSKENPCGDKMIDFLRKTPEARKLVWEMMECEND
jgi:transcriptional regulator with XRE-family HTH domain